MPPGPFLKCGGAFNKPNAIKESRCPVETKKLPATGPEEKCDTAGGPDKDLGGEEEGEIRSRHNHPLACWNFTAWGWESLQHAGLLCSHAVVTPRIRLGDYAHTDTSPTARSKLAGMLENMDT